MKIELVFSLTNEDSLVQDLKKEEERKARREKIKKYGMFDERGEWNEG